MRKEILDYERPQEWEGEEEVPLDRGFGKGRAWDAAEPGPVLAVASAGEDDLAAMSENELLGVMAAVQRLMNQMSCYQTAVLAEYAARNTEWDPRAGREVLGEFAHEEVARELRLPGFAARGRAERSYAARQRLPRCLELAHAGLIGDYQLRIITEGTACVDPELAGKADAMIAGRAAELAPGQLRSLVAKVVHLVGPASAEEARAQARRVKRVEFGQELSGNAWLAAHELDVADAAAEIAGLGIAGAAQARDLIAAASHHPATRWCITEADDHGIARRHGCARGRHPWTPPGTGPPGPAAVRDFLRSLDIALEPAAQGTCDHRSQEPRHDPTRPGGCSTSSGPGT